MAIRFNSLLEAEGIPPGEVAVVLHTPEPRLSRLLPAAVIERPELFEAYQRTHPLPAERTLRRRALMASFLHRSDGEMIFVGLYLIVGQDRWDEAEFAADPGFRALFDLAAETSFENWLRRKGLTGRIVFSLAPHAAMAACRGRLAILRPPGRSYVRRAEALDAPVAALYPEMRLSPPPPDWRDVILSAAELCCLPSDWAAKLREWRGVYLILDESDGARYVGSACGRDNLLGRWQAHVRGETGVTVKLARRETRHFRFSILERLNPDCLPHEAVAAENRWKARLGTVRWGLNVA